MKASLIEVNIIKRKFCDFYYGELMPSEFDKWICTTSIIEDMVGNDMYFQLIDIDYSNSGKLEKAKYLVNKIYTEVFQADICRDRVRDVLKGTGSGPELRIIDCLSIIRFMARALRLEFPNALYHITSRGDRREIIYDDDEDRVTFLAILGNVITDYNWLCHSYCLMDNHYHLVIETLEGNLSKGMRQLNGVYTQANNRRHNRSGHLFQGRYKSILVDKEHYLLQLARYVVLNPVRAKGMVRHIDDWQWSSYLAFIGKAKEDKWLMTDWVLSQFGRCKQQARENFQRFVLEGVELNVEIWSGLKAQIYLGEEDFVSTMQRKIATKENDWSIPKKQKRPVAKALLEIEKKHQDRDSAIIAAYSTGAYSQREIAEHYRLHPSMVGVIVRKSRNSPFGT